MSVLRYMEFLQPSRNFFLISAESPFLPCAETKAGQQNDQIVKIPYCAGLGGLTSCPISFRLAMIVGLCLPSTV